MKPAIFMFEDAPMRTIFHEGNPWFVATDAARILGIKNWRTSTLGFPKNEKGVRTVNTLGGNQEMTLLSEPGLYRLIFMSRKESAEKFKTWVFAEVLPSLRKTGRYEVEESPEAGLARVRAILERTIGDVAEGRMPAHRASAVAALARQYKRMMPEVTALRLRGGTSLVTSGDIDNLVESWRENGKAVFAAGGAEA